MRDPWSPRRLVVVNQGRAAARGAPLRLRVWPRTRRREVGVPRRQRAGEGMGTAFGPCQPHLGLALKKPHLGLEPDAVVGLPNICWRESPLTAIQESPLSSLSLCLVWFPNFSNQLVGGQVLLAQQIWGLSLFAISARPAADAQQNQNGHPGNDFLAIYSGISFLHKWRLAHSTEEGKNCQANTEIVEMQGLAWLGFCWTIVLLCVLCLCACAD